MATTAKGLRTPDSGDSNDVPVDMAELAADVDDRLPAAMTSATRDALSGSSLWDGRLIWNSDTERLERYSVALTAWRNVSPTDVYEAATATGESTASLTFVDLATVGPSVTVTVGPSKRVRVTVSARTIGAGATDVGLMSCAVSGAVTRNAQDADALWQGGNAFRRSSATSVVTLSASGSCTFTAKYRVNSGTVTFAQRSLIVETL